ncbi:MAG: LysM domain-containing protein, partial [Oscillospiraceae bacterium]|nr:LysM domain-containing protein [Oscillospiraceae bacterium]
MFNYRVQPGDTLYRIADYFDVSVQFILAANPLINPNNIYPGLLIRIPISRNLYQSFPWYYLFPNLFIRYPRSYWNDRNRWPNMQPGRGGWPGRDGW